MSPISIEVVVAVAPIEVELIAISMPDISMPDIFISVEEVEVALAVVVGVTILLVSFVPVLLDAVLETVLRVEVLRWWDMEMVDDASSTSVTFA